MSDGVNFVLNLEGGIGDGVNPAVLLGVGSTLVIYVDQSGLISANSIEGADPGSNLFLNVVSPALTGISSVQPGFAGTTTIVLVSASQYVAYDDTLVMPLLGADNVQAAIDGLKAYVVSGGGSVAIWRGVGAPTAPGIFNTWADLFAWIQAAPGSKRVFLDSSFGPLVVDPGLWTFTPPVEFVGSPVDPMTELTLNEARFRNVWRWTRIKFLVLNTLNVPFGGFNETVEFNDCEVDLSGGAQPFIRTVTSVLDVTFRNMAVFPTTQLMFDMQPGAPPCIVRLYDGATVALNSFGTAVGTTLTLVQDSSSSYLDQAFVFGTLIRVLNDPSYIPGNPADWTFPAPTRVGEALDRLAAKFVDEGLGTP